MLRCLFAQLSLQLWVDSSSPYWHKVQPVRARYRCDSQSPVRLPLTASVATVTFASLRAAQTACRRQRSLMSVEVRHPGECIRCKHRLGMSELYAAVVCHSMLLRVTVLRVTDDAVCLHRQTASLSRRQPIHTSVEVWLRQSDRSLLLPLATTQRVVDPLPDPRRDAPSCGSRRVSTSQHVWPKSDACVPLTSCSSTACACERVVARLNASAYAACSLPSAAWVRDRLTSRAPVRRSESYGADTEQRVTDRANAAPLRAARPSIVHGAMNISNGPVSLRGTIRAMLWSQRDLSHALRYATLR